MARARWVRWTVISAVAMVMTLVVYYPLVLHPNSTVLLSPNDASSTARDLWAAFIQHKTPFSFAHDQLLLGTLGSPPAMAVQIANALQPLFVEATHWFAGDLGSLNLFMLVGIVASLVAMFALLESFGLHTLAAAAGAIAFAWSPMSVEQLLLGHFGFAQLWVFPLLLSLLIWARTGRALRALALGLAYALSFYAFGYLGLLCSLVVVTFALALVWQRRSLRIDLPRVGLGIAAALVGLLPAALATRIAGSPRTGLPDMPVDHLFGANFVDYLVPSSRHILYGRAVRATVGVHVSDHVEFFGYATLVLAAIAVVMAARRRLTLTLPLRFAILAVPLGWLAALPAQASIFGTTVPLPDPARIIGSLTSVWRVYDRLAAVAGFGLVILAATAMDRLLRSGRRGYVLAAGAAAVVMLFEALPGLPAPAYRLHVNAETRWLAAHPGGAVAMYPTEPAPTAKGTVAWHDAYWLSYYLQIYHRHPLLQEASGAPTGTKSGISAWLAQDISAPTTPSFLRTAGVRWVVLRRDLYSKLGLPAPRIPDGLKVAATFPGVQILRVTAPPANLQAYLKKHGKKIAHAIAFGDANVSFGKGFYAPEQYGPYAQARWLRQDGNVSVKIPDGVDVPYVVYEVRFGAFSTTTDHKVTMSVDGRPVSTFTVPTGAVVIDKLVRFPGPSSTLTFSVSPGPVQLSANDKRLASVYFLYLRAKPVGLKIPG